MSQIDETHDPLRQSWVGGANGHPDFPIQNLPFGVFSTGNSEPRIGVAIGDMILDLKALCRTGQLDRQWHLALGLGSLNAWFAHGQDDSVALRRRLSDLLSNDSNRPLVEPHLVWSANVEMHLPCRIGDYTDFYVGIHHATNVGKQFRPDNPLLPNYKYVPIGYHGRASSVRVSGEPVVRPKGQRKPPEAEVPEYGPSRRLDYELELGIFIGKGNELGTTIPVGEAAGHIAG
jgi:fumarylacetoacetase